jgi:hypothetical protein
MVPLSGRNKEIKNIEIQIKKDAGTGTENNPEKKIITLASTETSKQKRISQKLRRLPIKTLTELGYDSCMSYSGKVVVDSIA